MKEMSQRANPKFWRVHCHIGHHPGQWQYWFREQCCAVGWAPPEYTLAGVSRDQAWTGARNALVAMQPSDWILASLPDNRVGRLGQVVQCVRDDTWNPIVPASSKHSRGENGRRILVRWDLTVGPDDPSKVVLLPKEIRFTPGEARATIRSIPIGKLDAIRAAMCDERNWTSVIGNFKLEAALSDYLAMHPGRLESGMISHPSLQARELSFDDRRRADVILQDRNRRTVIAECKQGAPTKACIDQVVHYRAKLCSKHSQALAPRAMLIHGGATRVPPEIADYARRMEVELTHHELRVDFFSTGG